MNYTRYIRLIRSNLCQVMTQLRNNEKRIKKIDESIENLETDSVTKLSLINRMACKELNVEIDFYEALNSAHTVEINRLVRIILENPTEI